MIAILVWTLAIVGLVVVVVAMGWAIVPVMQAARTWANTPTAGPELQRLGIAAIRRSVIAFGVTTFVILLFHYGLGVPIHTWPWNEIVGNGTQRGG
jgi:hypothetical protein